jgi:hypothetical protein
MPEPRCGSAHGVEAQSEGDFEAFGGDLVDEIACAADFDAERAAEPLPRLGYDVLVDSCAGGFAHWLDRDDRAVIGNFEITHCGVFYPGGVPRRLDPGVHAARRSEARSSRLIQGRVRFQRFVGRAPSPTVYQRRVSTRA